MRPYRRTGAGRREFGRLVLASLEATARAELETRRARGQRLRARRAERRLAELQDALDRFDRGLAPLPTRWYGRRAAEAVAAVVALASLAGLVAALVLHGPRGLVVGAADAVMLLATLAWFVVAVGRRAASRGAAGAPPNGGSPARDRDR